MPLYYVSKLARDSGTIVVQVGEGSDEIFSGYDCYGTYLRIYENFWRHAETLPPVVAARRSAVGGRDPLEAKPVKKRAAIELIRRLGAGSNRCSGAASVVYDETFKAARAVAADARALNGLSSLRRRESVPGTHRAASGPIQILLARMTYLELKLRLPELLLMRVDKITMATIGRGARAVSRSSSG